VKNMGRSNDGSKKGNFFVQNYPKRETFSFRTIIFLPFLGKKLRGECGH